MSIHPESVGPAGSCRNAQSAERALDTGVRSERIRAIRDAIDPGQTLPIVRLTPGQTLNPLIRPFDIYHGRHLSESAQLLLTYLPGSGTLYMAKIAHGRPGRTFAGKALESPLTWHL